MTDTNKFEVGKVYSRIVWPSPWDRDHRVYEQQFRIIRKTNEYIGFGVKTRALRDIVLKQKIEDEFGEEKIMKPVRFRTTAYKKNRFRHYQYFRCEEFDFSKDTVRREDVSEVK